MEQGMSEPQDDQAQATERATPRRTGGKDRLGRNGDVREQHTADPRGAHQVDERQQGPR